MYTRSHVEAQGRKPPGTASKLQYVYYHAGIPGGSHAQAPNGARSRTSLYTSRRSHGPPGPSRGAWTAPATEAGTVGTDAQAGERSNTCAGGGQMGRHAVCGCSCGLPSPSEHYAKRCCKVSVIRIGHQSCFEADKLLGASTPLTRHTRVYEYYARDAAAACICSWPPTPYHLTHTRAHTHTFTHMNAHTHRRTPVQHAHLDLHACAHTRARSIAHMRRGRRQRACPAGTPPLQCPAAARA